MATFKLQKNGFIYLYHWIDRKNCFRITTKMKLEERDWNSSKSRPKNPEATYNGYKITNQLVRYEAALTRALALQPEVTKSNLGEFKKLFISILSPANGNETKEYNFLSYFDAYLQKIKERKQSNYKAYRTCYNRLTEYFKSPSVPFDKIDMKFYEAFSQFLISKNLATNTIATQWKLIKAVMQSAFVAGLHSNEKFRHFKKKMESADTIFLSEEELNKMYELKLIGYLEKARDYFLIGAYTGLRFEDWDRVSSEKVVKGVLTVRSSKTGELSTIPIHPVVSAILDKYEGELPHKPSNQKMNEYIKVVAMRANIKDHVETRITKGGVREINTSEKHELVTTHKARRSLATNLVLRGVSPYVVMKVTGHKSLSSFERYVRLQELEAMIELKSLSFFQ
jgi:site-specific recombinase XerD